MLSWQWIAGETNASRALLEFHRRCENKSEDGKSLRVVEEMAMDHVYLFCPGYDCRTHLTWVFKGEVAASVEEQLERCKYCEPLPAR